MKIYVYDNGEAENNILSNKMIVDLQWDIKGLKDIERNVIRRLFIEFAKKKLDFCYGKVKAVFVDECLTCKERLKESVCINKMCPEYQSTQEIEEDDKGDNKDGRDHSVINYDVGDEPDLMESFLEEKWTEYRKEHTNIKE